MERDAHAWLEEENPRTLEWQTGLDAVAREHIHGLAAYPPLATQLPHLQPANALVAPRRVGRRWARRRKGANVVDMADAASGPWSPLPDLARRMVPISLDKLGEGGASSLLRHILDIAAGQAPVPDVEGVDRLFTAPCRTGVAPASALARVPTLIGRAEPVAAYGWRRGWQTAIVRGGNGSWWWVTCGADPDGRRISLLSIVNSWGVFSPSWHLVDYVPSPGGTYIGHLLACGSPEAPGPGRIRVVETRSRRSLADVVEAGPWPQMAWLPDESGFVFNAPDPGSGGIGLWSHVLGARSRPVRPAAPVVEAAPVRPLISPNGRWLGIGGGGRLHAVLDRNNASDWIAMDMRLGDGAFHGDRYVALDPDSTARGRIVSIPLPAGAADRGRWRELIPGDREVLRGVVSAGDRLVLSIVSEGQLGLRIHSWGGAPTARITPPSPGGLVEAGWPVLRQESPLSSPVLWSASGRSGSLRQLTEAELRLEDGVCERHEVPVSGGEKIWIEVVRRGGDRLPQPTLLYGYGFMNHVLTARWMPVVPAFTAAGGAFVFVHLRGGGEYGPESWHHAQAHRRETTVEDLFAVIRYLVHVGVSDPDRIAFSGSSAAGLLAGIVLTERPELFRVVAAIAPPADYVRFVKWLGPTEEFGTPAGAGDPEELRSLSPYHLVRDGRRYPAVLIGCGDRDGNCLPWHARKLAARLREANAAATPILLRVWQGGHEVCDAVDGVGERGAECLAFLMDRLGMTP